MKSQWLHSIVLRAASLLAPADQRAEWLDGWRSEFWYIPRRGATRFCLGAFRDALWLRRNNLSPETGPLIRLNSPVRCLAVLAVLAAAAIFLPVWLLGAKAIAGPASSDPLSGLIASAAIFCLGLPAATALTMKDPPSGHYSIGWARKLRWWIFLALKIVLVQPVMVCGCLVLIRVPMAPCVFWILTLRWVLIDQRRRCPVCLRLLTNPVRIGNSSHTFLEWYGAESICSRGHGLQHIPETSASYSGKQEWLTLDASWSRFFSEAAGARQR
jgi:hypothetical protein